uniref:Cilia- and flagella-associated protein 45 n=1 Tax=Cyanoderma ruficeps TaxID=181631 RepID=A0A8C3QRN9_9PASS
ETLKKAQMEEQRKAELEDKRNRQSDLEEEQEQQEKQKLLQRARRMRLEQDEEIRELNALFLNAKCNMIRDKQVLEKQMIHKELAEEEKRLNKMMEMERDKGMEVQEELERHRKQELMRARQDIVKQMEQNAEERALRAEEVYQEGQRRLERLEQMKREDRKVGAGNRRCREVSTWLERVWQCWISHTQGVGTAREAAWEAEQEQLRLGKEKELARLRAMQEQVQDWQAERDALRAKRNQEVAEREWRRQELEKARKKAELEQQLRQDRLEQVAQKEQYLAMQVEQDRQEFQRVLKAHQEQLEREKLEREQRELRQRAHAEYLRQQIQELQQQKERERAAVLEEGRQQEQEVRQRRQRLTQLRQQKLQEFRSGAASAAFLGSLSPSCSAWATSQLPLHPQQTGPAAEPRSQIHWESNGFFPLQSQWNSCQVLRPCGAQSPELSCHSLLLGPVPRGTSSSPPQIWGSISFVLSYEDKAAGVTNLCVLPSPPS